MAEYAADIEQLNRVPGLELGRQVSRITSQGFPVAERADDDVTLINGRHAARRQFELVVTRLVVEDSNRNEHTLLAGDVRGQAQFVAELAVLGNGSHFIDDDALHDPSARVCNDPGKARMRA